jgi:hypothetical protein
MNWAGAQYKINNELRKIYNQNGPGKMSQEKTKMGRMSWPIKTE